jgi:hypothetical protein
MQLKEYKQTIEVAEVEAACKEAREREEEEERWAKVNKGDIDKGMGTGIGTYVTDLVRLSRDLRRQLALDRYFLSQEAEAGDLLIEDDLGDNTTDTKSHLAGGWDKDDDDDFDPDEVMEDFEIVQHDYRMSP